MSDKFPVCSSQNGREPNLSPCRSFSKLIIGRHSLEERESLMASISVLQNIKLPLGLHITELNLKPSKRLGKKARTLKFF
jgi:hypothetical protein